MLCGDALSFNKAFDRSRKKFVRGIPTSHLEPLGVTVWGFQAVSVEAGVCVA